MKIFLAGTASHQKIVENKDISYILESFFYIKEWQLKYIKSCSDFLLDSGAFTFMQNKKTNVNLEEYIERYADFINRNNISNFFELDVDNVVGYKKVLQFRQKLEKMTGKQVIPVWHKSRGIDDYKRMCDMYDYVAIGGIVSKEIRQEHYKLFPALINEAHKRKAKIHGLGFTSTNYLSQYHFDSIDSTSWSVGGRYGSVYRFDGKKMLSYTKKDGERALSDKANEHNLLEWIKFQKYAEVNL